MEEEPAEGMRAEQNILHPSPGPPAPSSCSH